MATLAGGNSEQPSRMAAATWRWRSAAHKLARNIKAWRHLAADGETNISEESNINQQIMAQNIAAYRPVGGNGGLTSGIGE